MPGFSIQERNSFRAEWYIGTHKTDLESRLGSFLSTSVICRVSQSKRGSVLLPYFLGYRWVRISMDVLLCAPRSSAARVIGRKIACFASGVTVIRKYANAITASGGRAVILWSGKTYECLIVRNTLAPVRTNLGEREDVKPLSKNYIATHIIANLSLSSYCNLILDFWIDSHKKSLLQIIFSHVTYIIHTIIY